MESQAFAGGLLTLIVVAVVILWLVLLLLIPFVLWRIRSEVIAIRAMQQRATAAVERLAAETQRALGA